MPARVDRLLTACLLIALPVTTSADLLSGRIVSVADGDSLTLLDSNNTQYRIRIGGIDAPEKAQPFGERSKQNMARLAFQKEAKADCYKTDRYRRLICTVVVGEKDVGLAQLEVGLAWWYRKYAKEQTLEQRLAYEVAEARARVDQRGLWQDENPVPPWEFRHSH